MYVPRNEKNLLYAGLAAFGILFGGSLAMILTGCSYPSAPGAAQGADPAALFQDADGLVAVTVPLPAGGGGGSDPVTSISRSSVSRSLNPSFTKNDVDNYEVLFRTQTPSPDTNPVNTQPSYKAEAKAGDSFISVSVMPGVTYDVLLLAGYGDVLLAAGYALNNTIEKGVKNTIVITMKSITPQWDIPSGGNNAIGDKNDFTFTAAGLDADTGSANGGVPGKETELTVNPVSRSISISPTTGAKQGLPRIISDSSFTVTFNLSRLSPLILASKKESGSYVLKFASQRVAIEGPGAAALAPQYNDVLFSIGNAAGAAHASGAYTVTSSLTEEAIKAAGGVKAVYTVSGSVQDGTGAAVQTGGAGLLGVF